MTVATHIDQPDSDPAGRLSTIDRFLPLWILLAMALGIAIGKLFPGFGDQLDRVTLTGVSLPLALGLLWMMYPVLAKVRFETLGRFQDGGELFGLSMVLNWVVGPLLMFGLAWIFLPDEPRYRNGLILIGLARCIAMVLIWNSLACGDGDVAAVLVAINSVFQIVMYSVLGWLFLTEIPGLVWRGHDDDRRLHGEIARNVLIFLGIPLLAAIVTRYRPGSPEGSGVVRATVISRKSARPHCSDCCTPSSLCSRCRAITTGQPVRCAADRAAAGDLFPGDVLRRVLQRTAHRSRL